MKWLAWLALASVGVQAADMIELRYQDQDPGDAPYLTRVLMTDRYLRLDDGNDSADFVLLERKSKTVTNVLHSQNSLTRLPKRKLPKARAPGHKLEEKVTLVRPGTTRVQISSEGKLCSETVAAKNLLPEASKALAEYKSALAYTQWQTYQNTPADMRQHCDLVNHVWYVGRAFAYGLPLEERDDAGRTRQLIASGRRPVNAELFKLPKHYTLTQLPGTAPIERK